MITERTPLAGRSVEVCSQRQDTLLTKQNQALSNDKLRNEIKSLDTAIDELCLVMRQFPNNLQNERYRIQVAELLDKRASLQVQLSLNELFSQTS